jgi:hypothetical protein
MNEQFASDPGSGHGPHVFYSSVARNSDLWDEPFDVVPIDRGRWETGDFVMGQVTGNRSRLYECETKTGRMAGILRGDRLVGALGTRAATLEASGDWRAIRDDGRMHALTNAGLFGRLTSISPMLPDLVAMDYLGHLLRGGEKLGMKDFKRTAPPAPFGTPVILLVGTSMSSGKTTSGQAIIRELAAEGLDVVAAKLTGAARFRDILTYRDAGVSAVFDFVDAGLPSTVCPESEYQFALSGLLDLISETGGDVAVIEAGASPLEPYNGSVVIEALKEHVVLTVLCASDPYAVLGVQKGFGETLRADLVAGPAANTGAAVELVHRLTGLKALNLIDPSTHPELRAMLKEALDDH